MNHTDDEDTADRPDDQADLRRTLFGVVLLLSLVPLAVSELRSLTSSHPVYAVPSYCPPPGSRPVLPISSCHGYPLHLFNWTIWPPVSLMLTFWAVEGLFRLNQSRRTGRTTSTGTDATTTTPGARI